MNCPRIFEVAPYALGTLDAADREGVSAHLPGCADCQAVLESVAGLPGLLARIGPEAVEPDADDPDPDAPDEAMFERLVARSRPSPPIRVGTDRSSNVVLASRRSRRAPRRRRRWVAALAAAAVVGIGGAGWLLQTNAANQVRLVSATAGAVHARVWLRPSPSGTAIRLELGGVPPEQHCSLVAVGVDGRRDVAATWEATYSGTATFDGGVPIPVERLASLRVETDQGTLLTLPVH